MKRLPPMPAAYRALRVQLARVGWLGTGSVLERGKPGQGGPRYQWSRRVGTKTVTVALSREQFEWLQAAIRNQRELWDLLTQMQQMSLDYMWKHLPSTKRRKRLSKRTMGLK